MRKISALFFSAFAICLLLCGCQDSEMAARLADLEAENAALRSQIEEKSEFENAVVKLTRAQSTLSDKNKMLDMAIDDVNYLIASSDIVSGTEVFTALQDAAEGAVGAKQICPDIPDNAEAIAALADRIAAVDYSEILQDLEIKCSAVRSLVSALNRLVNPSEDFISERLSTIPGVIEIACASERNDPNHKLNKAGGYTADIFFAYETFGSEPRGEASVLARGTDGGGCVEVYPSIEDAENRDSFLSAFDGTIIDSGSHIVIGTCVIRTSCKLSEEQQEDLERAITNALLRE